VSTPHNEAKVGDVAETVIMPGDPFRAKFISKKYLTNVSMFNEVRGALGFTGEYKERKISVMSSGMGMPSMGIYSYELFNFYEVKRIIRVGTTGAYADGLNVRDILIPQAVSTNSNYASQFGIVGSVAPVATFSGIEAAVKIAREKKAPFRVGSVLSSDTFYSADENAAKKWKNLGVLGVEMECAALFLNAMAQNKKAVAILTVSDHIFTGETTSSKERETSFVPAIELALDLAVSEW
jgi:purine-nucleoside phosphorylase